MKKTLKIDGMMCSHCTGRVSQVLNAIDLTISVIPCAICVVNAILSLFYPISQKKHKEIMDELIRRRTVTN